MRKSNTLQILLLAVVVPCGIVYWYLSMQGITIQSLLMPGTDVVRIGNSAHRVEVADSEEERVRGLSGRDDLKGVDGMLFVFPEADYHGIWMKDMKFPIDIIWISKDLKVISVDKRVSPDTYPRTFRPSAPAQYVLETKAEYTEAFDISPGDQVQIPDIYIAK